MRGRSFNRHTQHNHHVQHIVHANGEVTTHHEPTISYKVPQSSTMQRKRLLVIVVLFIVGVGIFFGIRFFVNDGIKKDTTSTEIVSSLEVSAVTRDAIGALNEQEGASFDPVIAKINATSGADSNQTFLYIKLKYYLSISDAKNARSTYNALEKVYDQKVGYDALINESATSLDMLKSDVEFLEKQAAQVDKNAWGSTVQ